MKEAKPAKLLTDTRLRCEKASRDGDGPKADAKKGGSEVIGCHSLAARRDKCSLSPRSQGKIEKAESYKRGNGSQCRSFNDSYRGMAARLNKEDECVRKEGNNR